MKNRIKKKKRRLKKQIIYFLIFFIPIPILIFSTYNIIIYLMDSPNTKNIIKEVIKKTEIIEYNSEDAQIIESGEKPNTPYWNFIKMKLIDVNLADLKKKNDETIGWIYVGGTSINYPIVQTTNNDYYLDHSFDKSQNDAGWLFMDYRNNINDYDKNTIIYAHNRKDKTMFGTLKNLLTSQWYNIEDNRIIKMSSENNNTLWQIFSVYTIETTNDYIQTVFYNDDEYSKFLSLIQNRSYTTFNTNVTSNDKILTLSTCHGKTKKLVVHAKLIKIESN